MTVRRRILVTSALPYANGPIHLGYLLEAVQTDIWVRFQKLRGHECYYVCADDTHGTPMMLKAQADGITPEALIERVHIEHRRDLLQMSIGLDNFGSTHSPETKAVCDRMYLALRAAGHIDRRIVRQAYDATAKMFLPDRYVKGLCPNCSAADQYGDSCENCGATYTPADLQNPLSVVTGTVPVWRESEHYFFRLSTFEAQLASWVKSGAVQQSVAAKLNEWFTQGLKDWDISRDAPYFGFEIPDAPDKYFYVWFDAPIGYLGSLTQLCARTCLEFDDFLNAEPVRIKIIDFENQVALPPARPLHGSTGYHGRDLRIFCLRVIAESNSGPDIAVPLIRTADKKHAWSYPDHSETVDVHFASMVKQG